VGVVVVVAAARTNVASVGAVRGLSDIVELSALISDDGIVAGIASDIVEEMCGLASGGWC
jgi:hypothetical protein